MKKLLSLVLCGCLILSVFAGCGSGNGSSGSGSAQQPGSESGAASGGENVIKIGVVLPFSGGSSYFGESQLVGYQHAIQDYYEHFEADMNGMKVELVLGDSASVADTGVTEFERLVNVEKVSAIIGTYNSGTAAAIAPLAIKNKIPFMVTNAVSDVILAEDNNYIFRANMGDYDAVTSYINLIKFLREKSGTNISKAAIIYEGTDYGQGAYNNFLKNIFPELGIEVVLGESFANNSSDLSSVINKIKHSGADIVIPVMFLNDALLFSRQLKEYNVNTPIIAYGGGFLGDDYVAQAADAANYILCSGSWIYDENALSEDAKQWSKKFIEETGNTVANEPYANGWLGMYTLLQAIARAGANDKEAIARELDATDIPAGDRALLFHTTFEGVRFEDVNGRFNQNSMSGMMFGQVLDGRYQIVFPADVATGKTPLVFPVPEWSAR